jgi:hypothetical protein
MRSDHNDLTGTNLRRYIVNVLYPNGVYIMKKLFAILVVSLMTISSFAMASGCSGDADYDHDAKKKMEKGA